MYQAIHILASYMPQGKEKQAMKHRTVTFIIVSITLLAIILAMRRDLCEIRFRTGNTEFAAFMAYETR